MKDFHFTTEKEQSCIFIRGSKILLVLSLGLQYRAIFLHCWVYIISAEGYLTICSVTLLAFVD